jgi:hypothetical protein
MRIFLLVIFLAINVNAITIQEFSNEWGQTESYCDVNNDNYVDYIDFSLIDFEMTVSISKIGASADIHNTDLADQTTKIQSSGPRFYSEALTNLQSFVTAVDLLGVDAIIQVGDQIDSAGVKSRMTLADEVQAILHSTDTPAYNVMGNWELNNPSVDPLDFDNSTEYFTHIKNAAATYDPNAIEYTDSEGNEIRRYYTFSFGSALGIVLDNSGATRVSFPDNEYYRGDADLDARIVGAYSIREKQVTWLQSTLAANTTVPIVVFLHSWLYNENSENPFNFPFKVTNATEVLGILEAHQATYSNIAGVVTGHHHPGGRAWWDDVNTTPPSTTGAVFHEAYTDLIVTKNGIKHVRLAAPIRGWGSSSAAADTDPSNIYYLIEVGVFVTGGSIDIRVTGFGTNPTGDSASTKYLVL